MTTTTSAGNNPSKHPVPWPSSTDTRRMPGTSPPRSRLHAVHKFSLPVLKAWGQQRVLRCVTVGGGGDGSGQATHPHPPSSTSSSCTKPDMKARSREDRVRSNPVSRLRDGEAAAGKEVEDEEVDEEHGAVAAEMPWSLRTRRGSYARPPCPGPSTAHPFRAGDGEVQTEEWHPHRLRPLFSVTLSKVEIEYDVMALTGRRAARRPRKRPRALKRQLDMLFPGYYLSEAAAESYDVAEPLPPVPVPDA